MSKLPPNACRLRVRYHKDGRLAYLGHLEVMGTIMRSIRRSHVPFEVGQGFAHRMRIQFSQALPVGCASVAEYFDLLLSEPCDAEWALCALRRSTPSGLAPDAARILPRRIAALEAWADRSRWELELKDVSARAFEEGLARVLAEGKIDFMRGSKPRTVDLASTFVSAEVHDVDAGCALTLHTRSAESCSLRPAVLVQACVGVPCVRVVRTGLWHEDESGRLLAPL